MNLGRALKLIFVVALLAAGATLVPPATGSSHGIGPITPPGTPVAFSMISAEFVYENNTAAETGNQLFIEPRIVGVDENEVTVRVKIRNDGPDFNGPLCFEVIDNQPSADYFVRKDLRVNLPFQAEGTFNFTLFPDGGPAGTTPLRTLTARVNPTGAPGDCSAEYQEVSRDNNVATIKYVMGRYPDLRALPVFPDGALARWCTGSARTTNTGAPISFGCDGAVEQGEDIVQYDDSTAHFWVHVVNDGTWNRTGAGRAVNHTFPSPADQTEDLDYKVTFELFPGKTIDPGETTAVPVSTYDTARIDRSVSADIFGNLSNIGNIEMQKLAGDYVVRITLDAGNQYRERATVGANASGTHPNVILLPIHIRAPDLTGNFSTTFKGATAALPAERGETVTVQFTVKNTGTATANRSAASKPIPWKLVLDPLTANLPLGEATIPGLLPGESVNLTASVYIRPTEGSGYIKPGVHTLRLIVDQKDNDPTASAGRYTESNESNNVIDAKFYVKDTVPPVIRGDNWHFRMEDDIFPSQSTYTFERAAPQTPRTTWDFRFNITEEDESFRGPPQDHGTFCDTCVWVNFTRPGKPPIQMMAEPEKSGDPRVGDVEYFPRLWFITNNYGRALPVGLYSIEVHARDVTGNVAVPLKLTDIVRVTGHTPKVEIRDPAVDPSNPRNLTIEYPKGTPTQKITFRFNVTGTGFEKDYVAITANTKATMKAPTAAAEEIPLVTDILCPNEIYDLNGRCVGDVGHTAGWVRGGYDFSVPRTLVLNVTVTDKASDKHTFLWNVTYRHEHPKFNDLSVTSAVAATKDVAMQVNFTTNFKDSELWRIDNVWAEIKNSTGATVANVSLTKPTTPTGKWTGFATTGLLEDGRPGHLPKAGTYRVQFVAKDQFGAVSHSGEKLFQVTDNVNPLVSDDSGPTSFPAEEGERVEFVAKIRDETTTTVDLVLLRSSVEFQRIRMAYRNDGTYNATFKFDIPGDYTYVFQATDSAGHLGTSTASVLRVEPNTFPRVTLTPALAKLGSPPVRYMQSNSLIEINIVDVNGVNVSSLRVLVNDQDTGAFFIDPKITDEGRKVTLRASFPRGNVGFPEGGTVDVVVFSADMQGKKNPTGERFRLYVDDTPPEVDLRTPLVGAFPVDGNARPVNVTQKTEFVFDATDTTGPANSFVREITVRVQSPGAHERKFVYRAEDTTSWSQASAPLRLTVEDLGGDYYGPGLYYFNVTAKDQAGNEGAAKSFLVNLYTRGPRVDLLSKAEDAVLGYVNASVLDIGGVGLASVRATATADGFAPRSAEMTRGEDQVWRARLDSFPAGTRVLYQVVAENRLGLTGASELGNYTAENHAPEIRSFLTGVTGPVAKGTITLNWTIFDLDSDTVQVALVAKPSDPNLPEKQVRLAATSDRAVLDTKDLADGLWTFVLRADDQQGSVSTEERRVYVQNFDTAVITHNVERTQLKPGEKLVVSAVSARQGAKLFLEYRSESAEEWTRFAMVEASDAPGEFSAAVDAPAEPGTYDMRIVTEYIGQDGKVGFERRALPSLTVESSVIGQFGENLPLWVGIAVLGAAALAVGGYALNRRWK